MLHLALVVVLPLLSAAAWLVASRFHGRAIGAFLCGSVLVPVAFFAARFALRPLFANCTNRDESAIFAAYAAALVLIGAFNGALVGWRARRAGVDVTSRPDGLAATVGVLSLPFVLMWPCG